MERGNIQIKMEEGKAPVVEATLINNGLWLTSNEIARFLGCFVQTVNGHLRSIFREHLLWERECSVCNRYIDKGIEKQTVFYNLEVLIFVSYRVNSLEARIFRQFIHSVLRKHLKKKKTSDAKIVWKYLPAQSRYRLN
ncbi:MAG: hypothetical protein LBE91_07670 [Tannerella sp.]|jgi:hypothetical protein|nr:hypothetical protein [Tannerella sp.]